MTLAGRTVAVMVVVLFLGGCSNLPSEPQPKPESLVPSVSVARVERRLVKRHAQTVGQLLADEEITISNEIAGRVAEVTVDFGSTVTAGQLLIRLDSTDIELSIARARAALDQSLASLGLSPDKSEDEVELDDVASVALAQATLEDAQTKLQSARTLVDNRDIPEQRYLELGKLVEQREASLRAAKDQARVRVATARLNRAQLAIEQERLEKTRIVAPSPGSVAKKYVAAGQYAKENSDLIMLVREDPLRLRGRVPEAGIGLIRKGLELRFKTEAHPNRWFDAVLTNISPILDPATRTLAVEARSRNPQGLLKPGMFVVVDLVVDDESPALMVPSESVLSFAGLKKLFVVGPDDKVSERQIETGLEEAGYVEVLGGSISENDRVVISNQRDLQDGMTVRVSTDR